MRGKKTGAELWPGARDLPWDEDRTARELWDKHGPFTQGELGRFFGVSRQRIDQIEKRAMRTMEFRLAAEGVTVEQFRELMTARAARERTEPEVTW